MLSYVNDYVANLRSDLKFSISYHDLRNRTN